MDFARRYFSVRGYVDRFVLGENLRAKTTRGAVLLGGASLGEQASRFARNMLLARLLAPSAFGTMAIVMSSASIVGSLTDVGLRVSVIRNPRGREPAYLNAGWWLAMGRSLGVYAICFIMAPWVARFYGDLEVSALLRVALLGALQDQNGRNENQQLQRSDCLAESDGSGGGDTSPEQGVSKGGTLRADQPSASSSGFGAIEHRRGTSAAVHGGILEFSLDCARLFGGSGHTNHARATVSLPDLRNGSQGSLPEHRSLQDAFLPSRQTNHSPLTTNH